MGLSKAADGERSKEWMQLSMARSDALLARTPTAGVPGWPYSTRRSADRLLRMSVTDLNADEDPDGRHTRRVVEVLAQMLNG
ncbi:hypothetical protein [Micromonospora sp. NPDC005172]|uniref:hypothetical protein n=1 Tax=Micromonospora sp. NPDC005172 TaxID=3156867 RepID=UPI0033B3EDD8